MLATTILAIAPQVRAAGVVSALTEEALAYALSGGGTVTFAVSGTITLTAPFEITSNTTVNGVGSTVKLSGGTNVSLFTVANRLTLMNLTLADGWDINGGALFIEPGASVVASNCVFSYNQAVGQNGSAGADGANTTGIGGNGGAGGSGFAGLGGAIYSQGQLTLLNCQFFTNSAFGGDGGAGGKGGNGDFRAGNGGAGGNAAAAYGGAVHNAGFLVASNCTFAANHAVGGNGGGGGAAGTGAFVGLLGSGGAGGGANGAGVSGLADTILVNCTFADNSGFGGDSATAGQKVNSNGYDGAAGGDAAGAGLWLSGTGAVTNCTFSANSVVGGDGGNGGAGDFIGGNGGRGGHGIGGSVCNSGTLRAVNCTVVSGSATGGTNGTGGSGLTPGGSGLPGERRGGNIANAGGMFILKNSILTKSAAGSNAYGTIADAGNNISSDATPVFGAASKNNTNPRLGAFADHGGPTKTFTLISGGPAVNTGDDAACAPFDQRGFDRPWGGQSDIGAVELANGVVITAQPQDQSVTNGEPVEFTVDASGEYPHVYQWRFNGTNLAGATTSQYAIASAQSTHGGGYSVVVANLYGSATSAVATLTLKFDLRLESPTLRGTNFTFMYPTRGGHRYRVEAKADLTNAGWTRLSTNSGTGGWLTNLVPRSGFPSRFFRVVEE